MEQVKSLIAGRGLTYVTPEMSVSDVAARMADVKIGAVIGCRGCYPYEIC
jgi:hypothetical protein